MEDLLRSAMEHALSLGAEYAEARHQSDVSERTVVKNGAPEVSSVESRSGFSLRVVKRGCMAFAAGNGLDAAGLRGLAAKAVRAADASGALKAELRMDGSPVCDAKDVLAPRVPFADVPLQERTSLLLESHRRAADSAAAAGCRLAGAFMSLGLLRTEKTIINSDGGRLLSSIPRASMNAFLTVFSPERGAVQRHISKGSASGWEGVESWALEESMAEEAATLAKVVNEASPLSAGRKDLVLGPEIIGLVAHESAGHPSEADRLLGREAAQAGETFLSERGAPRRVGRPMLNVVDDPTLPGSFGRYLYDDECVAARRRYLIRGGEFDELLHDRSSAAAMGTLSNGSSRSLRYDVEPIVRMANTFVEPGDHSLEELLEGVKDGIYMRSFMEWNIDDRRYNQRYVGLECHRIADGELAGLLRGPALEISTPALWSSIDAIGRDLEFSAALCGKGEPMQGIPVWTGGPPVRLRGVHMGGSA